MPNLDLVPRAHAFAVRLHRQHLGRLCVPTRLVLELPIERVFVFRCLICHGYWEVAPEEAITCPST